MTGKFRLFAAALLFAALSALVGATPGFAQTVAPCESAAQRQYDPNPDNDCGESNTEIIAPDNPTEPPVEPPTEPPVDPGDSAISPDSSVVTGSDTASGDVVEASVGVTLSEAPSAAAAPGQSIAATTDQSLAATTDQSIAATTGQAVATTTGQAVDSSASGTVGEASVLPDTGGESYAIAISGLVMALLGAAGLRLRSLLRDI